MAQLIFWSAFYYLMPAISVRLAAQTDWSVLHISITHTMAVIVWSLCAPLAGMAVDRGWGGTVMRMGGAVGTVVLVALSLVADRWVFSGSMLVLGACMATTLYDPCFALMIRRLDRQGGKAMALVTLVAGFATLLTFPLVLGLSQGMGWQGIMLVFAGLSAVAVCLLPGESTVAAPPGRPAPSGSFSVTKPLVLIAVAFGLVMLGHAIMLFLLPVALARGDGTGATGMLAVAILGPAQIVGRLLWQAFGELCAPTVGAVVLFAVFCASPLSLLVFGPMTGAIYGALMVQGACYGIHTILRPVLARSFLPGDHIGLGIGAIATVGLLLMAIGPAVGGAIWTLAGFTGLMGSVLCLNAVAFVLIVLLFRLERKQGTR